MKERFRAFWKASDEWDSVKPKKVDKFEVYGTLDFSKMHELSKPFLERYHERKEALTSDGVITLPSSVDFAFVNEGTSHSLHLYVGKKPNVSKESMWELQADPSDFSVSFFSSSFGYYVAYSNPRTAMMEFFPWESLKYLTIKNGEPLLTNPVEGLLSQSTSSAALLKTPLVSWELVSFEELPYKNRALSSLEVISALSEVLSRFKEIEENALHGVLKDSRNTILSPVPPYFFRGREASLVTYDGYMKAFAHHQFYLLEFGSKSPSFLVRELVWCALYSELKGSSPISPSELRRVPEGSLVRVAALKRPSWMSASIPVFFNVLEHYLMTYHESLEVELFGEKIHDVPFDGFEDPPRLMLQKEWEQAIHMAKREGFISSKEARMLESIELFSEQ